MGSCSCGIEFHVRCEARDRDGLPMSQDFDQHGLKQYLQSGCGQSDKPIYCMHCQSKVDRMKLLTMLIWGGKSIVSICCSKECLLAEAVELFYLNNINRNKLIDTENKLTPGLLFDCTKCKELCSVKYILPNLSGFICIKCITAISETPKICKYCSTRVDRNQIKKHICKKCQMVYYCSSECKLFDSFTHDYYCTWLD